MSKLQKCLTLRPKHGNPSQPSNIQRQLKLESICYFVIICFRIQTFCILEASALKSHLRIENFFFERSQRNGPTEIPAYGYQLKSEFYLVKLRSSRLMLNGSNLGISRSQLNEYIFTHLHLPMLRLRSKPSTLCLLLNKNLLK